MENMNQMKKQREKLTSHKDRTGDVEWTKAEKGKKANVKTTDH
jgi:hypothetical protein